MLLTFYRNVGCPICNLRFHEVEARMPEWAAKGLVSIAVYESTGDNLRAYMDDERPATLLIPDPFEELYALYHVERSTAKLMKGMLHGAMGKMSRGKKLFTKKIKQDGHMDRIGAEFLIDAEGTLRVAHYGAYLGDHLALDSIAAFVAR